MKQTFKSFREIIEAPNLTLAERFGKLVARIEGFEKEARKRLTADVQQLKEIPTSTRTYFAIIFFTEILGLQVEWQNVHGYRLVKEIKETTPK